MTDNSSRIMIGVRSTVTFRNQATVFIQVLISFHLLSYGTNVHVCMYIPIILDDYLCDLNPQSMLCVALHFQQPQMQYMPSGGRGGGESELKKFAGKQSDKYILMVLYQV